MSRHDAEGLVRTFAAAAMLPNSDPEQRALMLMTGCSEIPSCAGACAEAMKTRAAEHEGIPDCLGAYADRVLAATVLGDADAKLLREYRAKLQQHRTVLVIDSRGTRLDSDAQPLVPLGANPASGADAAYKRSGANDLYLVPLGDALKREVASGRLSNPLRLVVDEKTTYRVLLEALFTAGQNELSEFEICENSCAGRKLSFRAPRAAKLALSPDGPRHLSLAAIVVDAGISLKAEGGNIAPGCNGVGAGITFPRVNGALDLGALGSCLKKLKMADPAFESEDSATLSANPGTRLHEVMDVALALQGPSRSLFPDVLFAVPH